MSIASGTALPALLESGLAVLGQGDLTAGQKRQLLDFIGLLFKWNTAYNLTAVRAPEEMLSRHVLDSLSVRPFLQGARILDVGTGAGLPGIPLAIAEPTRHFVLLDSLGKRITFLRQVLLTLKLENVTLVQARIEAFQPSEPMDSIISRAFAQVTEYVAAVQPLLRPGLCVLAMKGPAVETELASWAARAGALPPTVELHPLRVPGVAEERFLMRWCLR